MDSMIKEINDNLIAILNNIKESKDNSVNTLDNIQSQMDKKVEEAKKYKVQVDSSKEKIKSIEEENKALEASLKELTEKYSKMNLVSLIEAGNKEIKSKINNNIIEINKEKDHIQELTNKARTIKDLLINLKKDKTIKEAKLENLKIVYDYYNDRINSVIEYAFDHANNLSDYKASDTEDKKVNVFDDNSFVEDKNIDLDNTMVFDEIANIDDDTVKAYKDDVEDKDSSTYAVNENDNTGYIESSTINKDEINKEIIDNISNIDIQDYNEDNISSENRVDRDNSSQSKENSLESVNEDVDIFDQSNKDDEMNTNDQNELKEKRDEEPENNSLYNDKSLEVNSSDTFENDTENEERINKINDLFSSINSTPLSEENNNISPGVIKGIDTKIDDAYKDVFGETLNENDLNKKDTLTDIFGNPIKNDELSDVVKNEKKIEDLFNENGIEFNKFREDEKNYLKQIYDEKNFNDIINVLKRNNINLKNIYHAFNLFGEITPNELENMISKLLNVGQSVEAIGVILEKLPKIKKYNLDEAIISYGDYVKDIDITELIMKAKELYKKGGNL